MFSSKKATETNILHSVLQDIVVSTGSPSAQPPAVEEGWDGYTRTVSAHRNGTGSRSFPESSGRGNAELSDWEKYYGEASSQCSTVRVLSPPPRVETNRLSKREVGQTESLEEYPQGLQLALIILGVCLSLYIVALNRLIVSTV